MPETRDFAALPTSWALTIWDALPLYLSIEVALAVVVVILAGPRWRSHFWLATGVQPIAGVAYLTVFDSRLAAVLTLSATVQIALLLAGRLTLPETLVPTEPVAAVRTRGGNVIGSVALACAVAAVIKVLGPSLLAMDSPVWLAVAVAGGLGAPVPLGAAAIPALATRTATGSPIIAAVWIVLAAARPLVVHGLTRWRQAHPETPTAA